MSSEESNQTNTAIAEYELTDPQVLSAETNGSVSVTYPESNEQACEGDKHSGHRRQRVQARARTISVRRLSKAELNRGRELYPENDYWKPKCRAECKDIERPCPFVSCKYHLYLDIHPVRGSIKVNFPDRDVWELTESCALDIADRGGITLEEVGVIMNLTRERVRQLETQGLSKLENHEDIARLQEYVS